MLRVGLTGGIACGKSHVLRRLATRGLDTIDLDQVAHALMAPGGAAFADVVAAFGPGILARGGTIDRKALGAVVFADPGARARIDALVHPLVRAEEAARAEALEAEGRAVLVSDAALLVEAGAHLRFDRLVVVHCPPDEQLRRLRSRDGIPEAAARARIDAQMPVGEKRRYAHVAIETSGTVAETEAAADRLAADLLALAGRPRPRDAAGEDQRLLALVHGAQAGPRGLAPAVLLEEALDSGGIELPRLARRLAPPFDGPWYRAAREGEGAPWPEALAIPLALWAAHAGMDAQWLVSAAASLARLTHAEPESVAGACLAALFARHVLATGRLNGTETRRPEWEPLSRRWGGAPPAPRVAGAIAAAASHEGDPAAAGRAAEAAGGSADLAAGLAGLRGGPARGESDPRLLALARRLS